MKALNYILAAVIALLMCWWISEIATMEDERPRAMEERANPPN